jgi:GNAT superfamily N-acetyltransferase
VDSSVPSIYRETRHNIAIGVRGSSSEQKHNYFRTVQSTQIVDPQELALLVEFNEARAYTSLIKAAPESFCKEHGLRAVSIGSAVAIVAETVSNSVNMNRVIGLGVAEPATQAMVDEIANVYASCGLSFGIELAPCARPKELVDWLRMRRIRRGVATAVHYRAAQYMEPKEQRVSVVRSSPLQRDMVAEICCSVFRMPAAAHAAIAATADIPEWRHWLAYCGSRPVAAALSFVGAGVGWLGWDATLPEFRGLGAQAALIVHRVNEATSMGCQYITAETAINPGLVPDPSYRNYERSGFLLAYERVIYLALGAANANRLPNT